MHPSRLLPICAAVSLLPLPVVSAADNVQQTAAYQASIEEEQVRAETRRLVASTKAMLEEFRKNPAAANEVALTEATLQKLQSLSDAEMSAVAVAFKEASGSNKPGDNAPKLTAASRTAKEVQVVLSRLADKLALYQDEAAIELRLTALIRRQSANQRQTRYLLTGVTKAEDQARESELTTVEQKAIASESDTLLQSLGRLAANPASPGRNTFAAAYSAGVAGQLIPYSQLSFARATTKDFVNLPAAQGKVIEVLQYMLVALNSGKNLEERLRTAEQQVRSLATREQALARTTTHASLPEQRAITRRQQEIAEQLAAIEREVAQLNPATAPLLDQTRQTMENLDNTLQNNKGTMDRPQEKLAVVNTQNNVASDLTKVAEALKKQGDAVAKANGSQQGATDPAQQALANATNLVQEAIGKMDMAGKLLSQANDANSASDARTQMEQAQGDLGKAMEQLSGAGNNSPQGARENLGKSSESLGKGEQQASQGGESRGKANASVGEARDLASKTLGDMQNALSAMGGDSRMIAGGQSKDPNGQPTAGSGSGSGWGQIFHHVNEFTAFSAVAKVSDKDRAALATLQREKSPPEYAGVTQQYLKNLADGVVPVQ